MDGKQIFDNFRGGDTSGLRSVADRVRALSEAYLERARAIKDLQERMARSWTGTSGAAAHAGAGPLEAAFRESADPLDMTTASADTQASSFERSGHQVVEVPPRPAQPQPWTAGLQQVAELAGVSPASVVPQSFQAGIEGHHAANETNVRVMEQYHGVTMNTKSVLPRQYGLVGRDGAAVHRAGSDTTTTQAASADRGAAAPAAWAPMPAEPSARQAGGAGAVAGAPGARRVDEQYRYRPEYLVEDDPDAAFGTDRRVSPPVLGEE
ncbi:hypothetical protein [Amycolatopsis panacis]|uniref:PPE domain-containing protein n=1 Tax=Amycolatopsis panacis TaxID=2340917 RepID=A0A419HL21_9PSEU|nr:hypothetical protein [Amycolatopsis panacis]RJQ76578.1 hypothetical protein D5S19_30330 [Amycolatopsis panacis]